MARGVRGLALAAVALGALAGPARAADITVWVDGKQEKVRFPPILRNGRTLVHLREAFEMLGVVVRWNPTDQSLQAWRSEDEVFLEAGDSTARVNGGLVTLDQPALMHPYPRGEGMVVPMRFLSQSFGAKVRYDAKTNRMHITTKGTRLEDSGKPRHRVGDRVEYLTGGQWRPARVLRVYDWKDREDNYQVQFSDKSGRTLTPTVTRRFLRRPR